MRKAAKYALIKTVPIFLECIFLGIAFGLLFQKSGLEVSWTFLISTLVYTGSVQFTLMGILTGGLSSITIVVTTLFINSRHAFCGLTFIQRSKEMEHTYPHMVFSSTDETYSLLYSMAQPPDFMDREWKAATSFIALFDQCYWVAGFVMGALMEELIWFDTTGTNFAMTALFMVICADQWEIAKTRMPTITGFIYDTLFLMLIRSSDFILPALTAAVAFLLFLQKIVKERVEEANL